MLQALKKIPIEGFLPSPGILRTRSEDDEIVAVAFMAALLRARKEEPMLQIGFGSGYETAILARISRSVLVDEDDPQRAQAALARLARLGIVNVRWAGAADPREMPDLPNYATIFMTGVVADWPQSVAARLRSGGRLVARIGGPVGIPHYALGQKRRDGTLRVSSFGIDLLRPVGLPSR
ncbi:MAG TPA: hypothetical protein VE567_03635 [Sphingomonas sp.]|nr:hypothetical protein [Sphingomonas sp.]